MLMEGIFTSRQLQVGVGIGFGLQGIINHFVSGLILLFERPIKVGDYIEIGGHQAEIKKIGESSLDFELLVWTAELNTLFQIKSELYQKIDRKFRLRNILVPFPQQDLHLHMTEKSSPAAPAETRKRPCSAFVS